MPPSMESLPRFFSARDLLGVDHELLVVVVDADGGAKLRIGEPHAVHLAAHAVAVGEVGDLHGSGEAALEVGVHARHVERAHLDPGRHVPVACRRTSRRRARECRAHRRACDSCSSSNSRIGSSYQRKPHSSSTRPNHIEVDVVPAGGAVEHQVGVRPGPFAQVARELGVLLGVAPGVQLEGGEALVDALFDVAARTRPSCPRSRSRRRRAPGVLLPPSICQIGRPAFLDLMSQASRSTRPRCVMCISSTRSISQIRWNSRSVAAGPRRSRLFSRRSVSWATEWA